MKSRRSIPPKLGVLAALGLAVGACQSSDGAGQADPEEPGQVHAALGPPTTANPEVLIFKDAEAANDHYTVWTKTLAALGLTYNNVFTGDMAANTLNGASFDNVALVTAGGGSEYIRVAATHKGQNGLAADASLRAFVNRGGHYVGSCMGTWNALSARTYDGVSFSHNGVGLFGMQADGNPSSDPNQFWVHGLWNTQPVNTFSSSAFVDVLGQYSLEGGHPANLGLPYTQVDGVKALGSGYFDESQPGFGALGSVQVIARAAGYSGVSAPMNGHPIVIQNVPAWGSSQGRVVGTLTHPEHSPLSQPYFMNLVAYSRWGQRRDPSATNTTRLTRPRLELGFSAGASDTQPNIAPTATTTVTLQASRLGDPNSQDVKVGFYDNDASTASCTKGALRDFNDTTRLCLEGVQTSLRSASYPSVSYAFSFAPVTSGVLHRLLARASNTATSPRISERTRLLAQNASNANLVDFTFNLSATTGVVGDVFNLSYVQTAGTLASSDFSAWDAGDGEHQRYGTSASFTYLAPGRYVASLALKNTAGNWNVKSRTVDILPMVASVPAGGATLTYEDAIFPTLRPTKGLPGGSVPMDGQWNAASPTYTASGFYTLALRYSPVQVAMLGVSESTLRLYRYNSTSASWQLGGRSANTDTTVGAFVFGPPTANKGDYGIDLAAKVVWANFDRPCAAGATIAGTPEWVGAGTSMGFARVRHAADRLGSGKVLVTGGDTGGTGPSASAELYDPSLRQFSAAASLGTARAGHTLTVLASGKALAAGGVDASTELYDPATNTWTAAAPMAAARTGHTATRLSSGKVLVAGGYDPGTGLSVGTAELYDPATNTWSPAGGLASTRHSHTATLLNSGKVLLIGGMPDTGEYSSPLASAELYDPATNTWTAVGSMGFSRKSHSAVRLPGDKVLVAGGMTDMGNALVLAQAELYDPATATFSPVAGMKQRRASFNLLTLSSGKVLAAGGTGENPDRSVTTLAQAELYDPATGTWSYTEPMPQPRESAVATPLSDGTVLFTGGEGPLSSAVVFTSKWK